MALHRLHFASLLTLLLLFSSSPLSQTFSHHRRSRISSEFYNEDSSEAIIIGEEQPETGSRNNISQPHEDEGLREIFCPKENLLLRYDLRAGKCAEIESRAHCGKNMIFREEIESSSYGYCDCDFENHKVPLVFYPPSNTCYPMYKQGYCKFGEWLVLSKEVKGPVCQRNQCFYSQPPKKSGQRRTKLVFPGSWDTNSGFGYDPVIKMRDNEGHPNFNLQPNQVPLNGSGGPCVTLGSSSKYCEGPSEKVIFAGNDIVPRCGVPGKTLRRLSIIPNACPPGSYYSIIGYCQPLWDF